METLTHNTQVEQLALPEWETPVITQLEIKMTMIASAGFPVDADGTGFTG